MKDKVVTGFTMNSKEYFNTLCSLNESADYFESRGDTGKAEQLRNEVYKLQCERLQFKGSYSND